MRVVVSKRHLDINTKLARELNDLAKKFKSENYSRINLQVSILSRRDMSVERKKRMLVFSLHRELVLAFSIDKSRARGKSIDSFRARIHFIRKIVNKLTSINYYLETSFLKEIKIPRISLGNAARLKKQIPITKDELAALEFCAYDFIEKAIILDKRVLLEYEKKESEAAKKENLELKDLGILFSKESELLLHLEAKLPPPKAIGKELLKEPIFTHWACRLFSLLSYFEHLYDSETSLLFELKKNEEVKRKLNKKIGDLIKEKSQLIMIMDKKGMSIKDMHDFTTAINL